MKIQVITLFPKMFEEVFNSSMMWKAQDKKLVEFHLLDLRDYGIGPRKQVDDIPYGGGDGMVLKPEPLYAAATEAKKISPDARVLLMTPRGDSYTQIRARQLAESDQDLIIICGHYEGYDERITTIVDEQLSIGEYVLTGGELPAMVVADSVVRLIPGVLGGETSAELESYSEGNIKEHPHYTRPDEFNGLKVPDVLLSGHHAEIAKWRKHNEL